MFSNFFNNYCIEFGIANLCPENFVQLYKDKLIIVTILVRTCILMVGDFR